MNKTAFMASEFNPFHKGHKYIISSVKQNFGIENLIAGMSGSFVQRGGPAVFDKKVRATAAVKGGADLVVQLPFVYCAQTAEMFALGAVATAINCGADHICFGAEDVLPGKFFRAAELIESGDLAELIAEEEENVPFAAARIKALEKATGEDHSFLNKPNNILALEYMRAIIKLGAEIKPLVLKRDPDPVPSSTIRKMLEEAKISEALSCVPAECYRTEGGFEELRKVFGGTFHSFDDYLEVMKAFIILRTAAKLENVADMPSGFSNRLKNKAYLLDKGSEAFLKTSNTKTVPNSRIRRCLINLLMGYSKEDMAFFKEEYPSYVRLLAAGEKGRVILREINESGKSVITKLSDFISSKKSFETADMKSIMFDMKADDLYYLNQNITGADLKYTPYIEKKDNKK